MQGRKKKFAGKKTKWQKRRIARRFARNAKGKKPLVEPLTIAPVQERQAALKQGKIVFYNGKQRIELPLVDRRHDNLAGIYKVGNRLLTLRVGESKMMDLLELEKLGSVFLEKPVRQSVFRESFFLVAQDLGNMELRKGLRGRGLGLKAASKAERHVRAQNKGPHSFLVLKKFKPLFEKLGYEDKGAFKKFGEEHHLMEKSGKFNPKDDLSKWHRIEAVDPKDGKARMFYFPIKEAGKKK